MKDHTKHTIMIKSFFGILTISCAIGAAICIWKAESRHHTEIFNQGFNGLKNIFDSIPRKIFDLPSFRAALDNFESSKFKFTLSEIRRPILETNHIFKYFEDPNSIFEFSQNSSRLIDFPHPESLFTDKILTLKGPQKEFFIAEFNNCVAKYMSENTEYLLENGIDTSKFFELYDKQKEFEKLMNSSPDMNINVVGLAISELHFYCAQQLALESVLVI